ncbi:MAG: Re/Si-specific NAD(P)(+) transhydrogenase subunit alpha, partial [Gammaproteobacteria bacterium]|nr:Re/Si-specific NAD(P)(+) transhydrogenase subunit alpha [Gammaproteobacteria bacterium]
MTKKLGIASETATGERRVALVPALTKKLAGLGLDIHLQKGAGDAAGIPDSAYSEVNIAADRAAATGDADIVFCVRPPDDDFIGQLKKGTVLVGFLSPQEGERLQKIADAGVTAFSVERIPRISRAQSMDALSSQAACAGYRCALIAADSLHRFLPMLTTAAGTIRPAKVLVIGAGVAGLAAIGAARSMGAIVRSFDTRPEVKEQVESMDAEFLMLDFEDEDGSGEGGYAKVMSDEFIKAEMALFAEQAKDVDIIITTALIPGKPAPRLITAAMVGSMKDGSVIVDLAAEQGGNCELTVADEVVQRNGVTIIGYTDLPSRLAAQSSQLYATNLRHLLTDMTPGKDGHIVVDMEDEVIRGATICKDGETTWPPPPPKLSAAPPQAEAAAAPAPAPKQPSVVGPIAAMAVGGLALLGLGAVAPPSFMAHFTVFVLACFVGYMVIWNVTPALHTPLMSVTNAISSIIIIGALLQISSADKIIMWTAVGTVL